MTCPIWASLGAENEVDALELLYGVDDTIPVMMRNGGDICLVSKACMLRIAVTSPMTIFALGILPPTLITTTTESMAMITALVATRLLRANPEAARVGFTGRLICITEVVSQARTL